MEWNIKNHLSKKNMIKNHQIIHFELHPFQSYDYCNCIIHKNYVIKVMGNSKKY